MNGYDAGETITITALMAMGAIILGALLRRIPDRWMRPIYLVTIPAMTVWFYLAHVSIISWIILAIVAVGGYETLWRR